MPLQLYRQIIAHGRYDQRFIEWGLESAEPQHFGRTLERGRHENHRARNAQAGALVEKIRHFVKFPPFAVVVEDMAFVYKDSGQALVAMQRLY